MFFLSCDDRVSQQHAVDLLNLLFKGENKKTVHHNAYASLPETKKVSDVVPSKGSFVLGNSAPERNDYYEMSIPAKASSVCTWYSGEFTSMDSVNAFTGFTDDSVASPGYCPTKLLLRLNSAKHEEEKDDASATSQDNYLGLVKTRVYDHLHGAFAFCTAYMSVGSRSRILIGSRYKDVYFMFVSNENMKAIVWTDRCGYLYETLKENKFFSYGMTPMTPNSIMVIHPQYTVSKWKKWRSNRHDSFECILHWKIT